MITKIKLYKNIGLNIVNLGHLNYKEVVNYYASSKYVLFPSLTESFGLPLLEACIYNCKIIAADLDYVYDIVEPSIAFDPFNAEKLANIIFDISERKIRLSDSKLIIKNKIFDLINLLNIIYASIH